MNDWNQIFTESQGKLRNFAISLTKNENDAADLMQDTFVAAFKHKEQFRADSKIDTWFCAILKNKFLTLCNKNRKKPCLLVGEISERHVEETNFLDKILQEEKNGEVNEVLEKEIPPKQAESIKLHYFENLTHKQIAEKLNVSTGTIQTRIFYARKRIQEALKNREIYG